MEQTQKILTTIFITALLAILAIPLISAAAGITLNSPKAGNNYTSAVNITATIAGMSPVTSFNVTMFCNITGGNVDTGSTKIGSTVGNYTANANVSVTSGTLIGVTDALTYNCSAFLDNATVAGQKWSPAIPGITFDSTAPICTIEAIGGTIPWKGVIDIEWSITDALSLITSHATIDGPQDQTLIIDTDAVEIRTLTSQETKYIGSWTVNASGVDRSGNNCTLASDTFKTYLPDDVYAEEPTKLPTNLLLIIGIIVIVYFVFLRKKR